MDREDQILEYVQERMTALDRATFEAELKADPSLLAELKVVQAVRADLNAETAELADPAGGWARISSSIDAQAAPVAAANDNHAPMRQWLQMAAAAVLAVGVWQLAVVPNLGDSDVPYQTVSEEADAAILQIIFQPDAPFGDIAAVLAELEGSLVDGPSAVGVVRVRFKDNALRDKALAGLAARTDLVADVFEQ